MKRTKQSTEDRFCKVCGQPLPKEFHKSHTMHPDCANKKSKDAANKKRHEVLLNVENRLKYECRYDKEIKNAKAHKREHICARCGRNSGKQTLCVTCKTVWKNIVKLVSEHPELQDPVHPSKTLCLCCHKPVDAPYRQTCNKCRRDYASGKVLDEHGKLVSKLPRFTAEQRHKQDALFAESERFRHWRDPKPIVKTPPRPFASHPLAQFLPPSREHKTDVKPDPVTRRSTRRDAETGNVWTIEHRGQCFGYLENH